MDITINETIKAGDGQPLMVISGPCVIEDEKLCMTIAEELCRLSEKLGFSYVFKASFDKANRTSIDSFRGPGLEAGLKILAKIKKEFGIPISTDIHEPAQAAPVAEVADILQIPAFLCRQTDLLVAAAKTGTAVNIKKGQFMAPETMEQAVRKVQESGNDRVILTERGSSFGYGNLVVDMTSLPQMRAIGVPVVFDATHSVQKPSAGKGGTVTGGRREFVPHLLRAAVAVGVDGIFLETHPNPDKAKSDGPNAIFLKDMPELLKRAIDIHKLTRA